MNRLRKILIALDQLLGSLLFDGIAPDETISAYVWRRGYSRRVALLDAVFGANHCKESYESEKKGTQNAPEYRP